MDLYDYFGLGPDDRLAEADMQHEDDATDDDRDELERLGVNFEETDMLNPNELGDPVEMHPDDFYDEEEDWDLWLDEEWDEEDDMFEDDDEDLW